MKIKKNFILREIAGDYVVVPVGETAMEFNGMITVNEVGAFLWKALQEEIDEEELVKSVLETYEADEATVKSDIREFLDLMKQRGILD